VNKLDFSIALREKGLGKNEMIKEMKKSGFNQSEINFYLKKSDEIYLNQLLNNKQSGQSTKSSQTFKSIILLISLDLLAAVFLGYASIGLIGLFVFWSLIKFGSFRR